MYHFDYKHSIFIDKLVSLIANAKLSLKNCDFCPKTWYSDRKWNILKENRVC